MANEYTVRYLSDGVEVYTQQVEEGAVIPQAPVPEKPNYLFKGWNGLPEVMPAENVTAEAEFEYNVFTLNLRVDDELYASYELAGGASLADIPVPEKIGYTFSGWNKKYKKMPAANLTLKGSFKIRKYMLTFIIDDDIRFEKSVEYGAPLRAIVNPFREHYTFSGFGAVPDTMPASDLEFRGTFTINHHPITFVLDDQQISHFELDYGSEIKAPDVPVKEGHVFSGWKGLPKYMPDEEVVSEGRYYIRKYRITYLVDGEKVFQGSVLYGSPVSVLDAPVRDGYVFSGWSEIPDRMPAYDVTVSGSFTEIV